MEIEKPVICTKKGWPIGRFSRVFQAEITVLLRFMVDMKQLFSIGLAEKNPPRDLRIFIFLQRAVLRGYQSYLGS